MDICSLYEDLKKYVGEDDLDDLFYDAPEGEAQIDIVRDMLEKLLHRLG